MRLATFHVSSIECALPVERLREIVEPPPITRVPGASPALRGVANLRGQVIPVLDVAIRLGLPPSEGGRPCLLIAEASAAEGACGLLVDGIRGIEEVAADHLLPPRRDLLGAGDWLAGFFDREGQLVLVLDVERLLDPETIRAFRLAVPRAAGARPAPPLQATPRPESGPGWTATRGAAAPGTPPSAVTHVAPGPGPVPLAPGDLSRESAVARAEAAWSRTRREAAEREEPPPDEPRAALRVVALPRAAGAAPPSAPRPRAAFPVPVSAPAPEVPPPARLPFSPFVVAVVAFLLAILIGAIAAITRRDAREARPRLAERTAVAVGTRPAEPARLGPPAAPPAHPGPETAAAWTAPPAPPPPAKTPAPAPPSFSPPAPPRLPETPRPAREVRARPPGPVPSAAPPARPAPLRPGDVYEVTGGDTLWSISRRMLGDPWSWPRIHAANRTAVPNPDLIRPGQRLTVPPPPAEGPSR